MQYTHSSHIVQQNGGFTTFYPDFPSIYFMPGNEDTDEKERPISESSASSIIYAGEGRLNRLTLEQGWMDTKRNLEKV